MSNEQETTQDETSTPKSKIKSRAEMQPQPQRQGSPPPLLFYILAVVLGLIVWGFVPLAPVLEVSPALFVAIFIRLMIIFLMMNRSFIGWILGIILEVVYIVGFSILLAQTDPIEVPKLWFLLLIHITALALLLTRMSRTYFLSGRQARPPGPRTKAQIEEDERKQAQADSPSSSSSSSSG